MAVGKLPHMKDADVNIALIVAMDQNRIIGRDGDLPWRLSNDLRHFKKLTMGSPMLMGRKTWESLPGALPGRRNIVLTRNPDYITDGGEVVTSVAAAIDGCAHGETLFVIGGAQLYEQTLGLAARLFVTRVNAEVEGDTRFPTVSWDEWREVAREAHPADVKNEYPHEFIEYERKD